MTEILEAEELEVGEWDSESEESAKELLDADGEDEFADLRADVESANSEVIARRELHHKEARLKRIASSTHPDHVMERQSLVAAIRELEEGIVWTTTGNVALFHEQHCLTCGTVHRFFQGWMTEQLHKTDAKARRLLQGHTIESFGERVEVHDQGGVDVCSACVESCIMINAAAQGTLQ